MLHKSILKLLNLLSKLPKVINLLIDLYRRDSLIWTEPNKAKIAVVDAICLHYLVPLFDGESFEIIYTRGEKLYLTPSLVWRTMKYIIKGVSLFSSYVLAILETIAPVLVVTWVDNSGNFQDAARLYRDARFLAVQNASRYLLYKNPGGNHPIYLTEFACFGENEVEIYTRYGAHVEQFYPIGSLTDSYYRAYRKTPSIRTTTRPYDLCLVSQIDPMEINEDPEFDYSYNILAKHLVLFCEKNKKTLCVATRYDPTTDSFDFEAEVEWYRSRTGNSADIIPNNRKEFTTYQLIDSSSVSLALNSTTLVEALGRGNRCLYCNFTGNDSLDFFVDGLWFLKDPRYEVFEKRLLELLIMTDQQFVDILAPVSKYLMNYNENMPTHVFLTNLVTEALNKQT